MSHISSILDSRPNLSSDFLAVQEVSGTGRDTLADAYSLAAAVLIGALFHNGAPPFKDAAIFSARFARAYSPSRSQEGFIQSFDVAVQIATKDKSLSSAFLRQLAESGNELYANSGAASLLRSYMLRPDELKNALKQELSPKPRKRLLSDDLNKVVSSVHTIFRSPSLARLVSDFLLSGLQWITVLAVSWNEKRWEDVTLVPPAVWSTFSLRTADSPRVHKISASMLRDHSQNNIAISSSKKAKFLGPNIGLMNIPMTQVQVLADKVRARDAGFASFLSGRAKAYNEILDDADVLMSSQLAGRATDVDIKAMMNSAKMKVKSLKLTPEESLQLERKLHTADLVRTLNGNLFSASNGTGGVAMSDLSSAEFDKSVVDVIVENEISASDARAIAIASAPLSSSKRSITRKIDLADLSQTELGNMSNLNVDDHDD